MLIIWCSDEPGGSTPDGSQHQPDREKGGCAAGSAESERVEHSANDISKPVSVTLYLKGAYRNVLSSNASPGDLEVISTGACACALGGLQPSQHQLCLLRWELFNPISYSDDDTYINVIA